ncbi:uncharacterized protein LOC107219815 isoform X1 [Neodiprion lecontei]|uniref:Uncharacterized protein LOC107219815 isoform X1 n=1 Tax=Neodiprion lecontei TaxID=441921 RepID=A0ABM3GJW1_NEOLC|nr:uncharacterized protein LOC107219815 isoform X1 [Neodiprion lecontei]
MNNPDVILALKKDFAQKNLLLMVKYAHQIQDINSQVAQFRDLLINIGQPRDSPELREKIRKLRRSCVEACKNTSQLVLPQIRTAMDQGIPADSPNLVLLFFVTQLFLRELYKSKNLLRIVPMDMTGYYESKAGPSNIGNVISQILLCKPITPNFNEEELCSIQKDSEEINALIKELQEFMPQSEADTGNIPVLASKNLSEFHYEAGFSFTFSTFKIASELTIPASICRSISQLFNCYLEFKEKKTRRSTGFCDAK